MRRGPHLDLGARRSDLPPRQGRVGNPDQDRDDARDDEGHAPAAVVDEVARDQGGTGNAQVAPHAIDGDAHPCVLPCLDDDGEPDGVIYGGEQADREQAEADLQGRARERRGKRSKADADEERRHHTLAAPLVGEPPGGQREYAEGKEAGRGVFDEVAITEAPFAIECERRYRGEDQREQMIEEVADIEQQEMQALTHELLLGPALVGRALAAKLAPWPRRRNPVRDRAGGRSPHGRGRKWAVRWADGDQLQDARQPQDTKRRQGVSRAIWRRRLRAPLGQPCSSLPP